MTILIEVMRDVFDDPNLAVDAVYTPPVGKPATIRVIKSRPDVDTGLMQTGTVASVTVVEIQVAEIETVVNGAELTLGTEVFEIRKPMRDAERLVWRCPLRKNGNA